MELFELVFDELAKEIKEAPGWLSLVILFNLLLFVPAVHHELVRLEWAKEEHTLASLVALAVFFGGDLLDTFLFPRDQNDKRGEKAVKTVMLLFAGFAVFLVIAEGFKWVGPLLAWVAVFPLYSMLKSQPPDRLVTGCPDPGAKKTTAHHRTGCEKLVPGYSKLTKSTSDIRNTLGLHPGIYAVSTSLVRKARKYSAFIWLPNETAKLMRSLVIAGIGAGIVLALKGHPAGLFLIPVSLVLLPVSFWLKGLHMRRLYERANELAKSKPCNFSDTAHGARVFFWCDDAVGVAKLRREGNNDPGVHNLKA